MPTYTVHVPPDADTSPEPLDRVRFVKDGFSFAALFFPVIWLLWHRLWLVLLAYVAVMIGIEGVTRFAGEVPAGILAALFSLWFALEARGLLRWTLGRRGYQTAAVVVASDLAGAERRYFATVLDPEADEFAPPTPSVPPPRPRPSPASGAIGLFPVPGGR